MSARHLVLIGMAFGVTACGAFEKIAYVDSADFSEYHETENAGGSIRILESVLRTGATTILWRNQSGALPRYPSAEEVLPLKEPPLDKRRIPLSEPIRGWARFDDCGTNLIQVAADECARRGVTFGIHMTTEENHHEGWALSPWNLEHPQFWCCARGGAPWPGRCSLAYDEVLAHKLRLVDELLATRPKMIYIDLYRAGDWGPNLEYVAPMEAEWRELYGSEPPFDWRDPRWTELVAKYIFRYLTGIRDRITQSGRPVELVMAIERAGDTEDFDLVGRAVDWRKMLRMGVIDSVAVACVTPDWSDPWGSTARIYGDIVQEVRSIGRGKVYFPIMSYNFTNRPGYGEYATRTGVSDEEAVQRLLELAKDAGGDGITMECVDIDNYTPEVCKTIASFVGEDPYIESTGTSDSVISTGYRMNGSSRVEVDFAVTDTSNPTKYIFGSNGGGCETSLVTAMFFSDTHFTFVVGPEAQKVSAYRLGVDTDRHTAIIDLPNDRIVLMTGGVTNAFTNGRMATWTGLDFTGKRADLPLSLFARFWNAAATSYANTPKMRIYGAKIYENGVIVRDFVPCLKEGVACFRDKENGGFIVGEDVSAFTVGGDYEAYPDDGYVSTKANENGGHLYFDTGYIVTPKTAVALDCALTENCVPTEGGVNLNGYLFSCYPRFGFNFVKYVNASNRGLRYDNRFGGFENQCNNFSAAFPEPVDDKDVRRTFFIDNFNCVAGVVTSGFTNQTVTCSSSSGASSSSVTLKLSGYFNDTQLLHAPLKIYGCKIWEEGVLKKDLVPHLMDGVPGLLDMVSGAFIGVSRYSDDTTSMLAYGGVIKSAEQDAYLESDGTTGLNTGYKMNGNSRLEVDFEVTDTNSPPRYIFGSMGGGFESSLVTTLYFSDTQYFTFYAGPEAQKVGMWKPGVDTDRHTAIMDLPEDRFVFMTGSVTNAFSNGRMDIGTKLDFTGKEADLPLSLFSRFWNASYASESKARIYSVRIYESGTLAHEFLPYGGGAVTGLYDTVTGDVISNGPSFTFGGAGQDHGQLKTYIKPDYSAKLAHRGTTTLTAYAPGANSYKWLMDGQPIAGGTDGILSVEWARDGTKTDDGYVHTYQAIAVYDDFYGVTREGEASASATITSAPLGKVIIIK